LLLVWHKTINNSKQNKAKYQKKREKAIECQNRQKAKRYEKDKKCKG